MVALCFASNVRAATTKRGESSNEEGTIVANHATPRNSPLGERLAREFPSLERSLAARSTSYEKTTRTVSGNEITGLAATKV
jgi:hypothetical protein